LGAAGRRLLRGAARTLVVEIDGDRLELTAATSQERRRLIEAARCLRPIECAPTQRTLLA
jgi:hypothetical protein